MSTQGNTTGSSLTAVRRPVLQPSDLRRIQRIFQRYHGCVVLCDHCKAKTAEYMRDEAEDE